MALFLPTLTLLLVVASTLEVYGCVCFLGQEPDQAGGPYGWSLAEQNPCDCTEFRLGGVNMKSQIKTYEVKVGKDPRVCTSKGQIVQPADCKAVHHAWNDTLRQVAGSMKHVSIGEAGVWGVDDRNRIYYKMPCGCSWKLISGELKQIDVGNNVVWGVSPDNAILYSAVSVCKFEVSWIRVSGSLKHVSVSQKGHVWGVNRNDHIYHRLNVNEIQIGVSTWVQIQGALLRQISVGSGGVWGVDNQANAIYRVGTYGDPDSDPDGSAWERVGPEDVLLKYVSSGDVIYAVDVSDAVYYRVGTSPEIPTGTVWKQIAVNLRQVESISSSFWGVDAQNNIYTNMTLSFD